MIQEIQKGRLICKLWPLKNKTINAVYREGFIVSAVLFGQKTLPLVIAFFVVWYTIFIRVYNFTFPTYIWPSIVVMVGLAVCGPLYGLYKLGKRSQRNLTEREIEWYGKVCKASGVTPNLRPNVMCLAEALHTAFEKKDLDPKVFVDEL